MTGTRELEAYCETCREPTPHRVDSDPSMCTCRWCGTEQQLMVPLA